MNPVAYYSGVSFSEPSDKYVEENKQTSWYRDTRLLTKKGDSRGITLFRYSYWPDLSRSTSSRERKRQAPRLRFFLVRPA